MEKALQGICMAQIDVREAVSCEREDPGIENSLGEEKLRDLQ